YWGDGVYKSDNGGISWKNMGLKESHHIGRVLIHPTDPNIVYVAALGHLYSDNEERGLYKTTDGGINWKKVLNIKENKKKIGVVDVVMHPVDPNILFAATFDKTRTPWTYNPGGPGSAIYKSVDAGETWKKLEGGLPVGFLGRIGIDISKSNPNVVYANIENVNVPGMKDKDRLKQLVEGIPLGKDQKEVGDEMYRSDDGGNTWKKVSPDGEDIGGGPAYYYQQVRIDPTDENHVYVLGIRVWETRDGGKTWGRPFRFGGDNHALWIDSNDPKHMLLGYDHGLGVTYDGGKHWYHPDELPLAQFYAIDVDMESPYFIYGGLQDNGSIKGPSTKKDGSPITLEDWKRTGGGDGMYNVVDYSDSRWLYNEYQFGPLVRTDQVTGETKNIAYQNQNKEMRWNWNAPILISPHDPATIYHAGNKLVKSTNRGESWEEVSPDLTTNDPAKIQGTGNIQYCTITALEESPLEKGVIWVGTDDGNVQLTKDGGKTWTLLNDNIKGNPGYWVSRVESSLHFPGRAYVTYTGYRRDDFRPFIYVTEDYGSTWKSISKGLPLAAINVVREDPVNANLLFVGTEMGVYVSIDRGASWTSFKSNMPVQPIHDLKTHPREHDLVVATHGRGIFITNIKPLQEMNSEVLNSNSYVFDVREKTRHTSTGNNNSATTNFDGESESLGVSIFYYLKSDTENIKVSIFQGKLMIDEFTTSGEKGMNSVDWGLMKRDRKRTEKEKKQYSSRLDRMKEYIDDAEYQKRLAAAEWIMMDALPGKYTAVIEIDGKEFYEEVVLK
ncbi:MAG: hypothetical protein OEW75_09950, partial [Cyclobacteriaceae bacterium]|nr:hypothetical protein [Cyclobacteriaceae bacterium]